MSTNTNLRGKSLICAMAVALVTLPLVSRADQDSPVARMVVSTAGLDLGTPAGAQELYVRLRAASASLCGLADREDPLRHARWERCVEKALGDAVTAVNRPLVTKMYVKNDAPKDSVKRDIDSGTWVVSK